MPATTIVTDDATTVIEDEAVVCPHSSFSWGAALAGAFVATAVTLFLLLLGTGFGLSLVTTPKLLHGATPTFLTLGAIYFLAAQAFGFAVGGHLAGRLIGPADETREEEEFRAGAHGLGVWAIGVVATALLTTVGAFVAGGSSMMATAAMTSDKDNGALTPIATGYWVDTLFRSTSINSQASLTEPTRYAQATQSDTQPMQTNPSTAQPPQQMTPVAPVAGQYGAAQPNSAPPADQTIAPSQSDNATAPPPADVSVPDATAAAAPPIGPRNIAADKAETGRIIDVAFANGGQLSADDRDQIARLVSSDISISNAAAEQRVQDVQTRIHNDEVKTADVARKVASYASLWAAFALLFSAIVATMAAVSARWTDDRANFAFFSRD